MFNEMRRKEKQTTREEAEDILKNGEYGVLAINGDYPYGVPVSYAFRDNKIYIHCAAEGHKISLLKKDSRVCFTVVGNVRTLSEAYDVEYACAIAFGAAGFPEGEEKREALRALTGKYSAAYIDKFDACMDKYADKTAVIEIAIDHLTGKKSLR